jgi:hypothetical protein
MTVPAVATQAAVRRAVPATPSGASEAAYYMNSRSRVTLFLSVQALEIHAGSPHIDRRQTL